MLKAETSVLIGMEQPKRNPVMVVLQLEAQFFQNGLGVFAHPGDRSTSCCAKGEKPHQTI